MTDHVSHEVDLRASCYFRSAYLKDDLPCDEKCADYMNFMEIPAADVERGVIARDCSNHVESEEANGEKMCMMLDYMERRRRTLLRIYGVPVTGLVLRRREKRRANDV